MAYLTRKAYGQHLRNYTCPCGRCKGFDWLCAKQIEADKATKDQIRAYIVNWHPAGVCQRRTAEAHGRQLYSCTRSR